MSRKIELSFIVPVYKVEKFLDECLKSIIEQDFTDYEIILVDDGSPDKCPALCDFWAEHNEQIKVIHKENGGLSDARNAGLKVSQGRYVWFVDSDDWLKSNAATILKEAMFLYPDSDVYSTPLSYYMDGDFKKNDFSADVKYPLSGVDYVNMKLPTGANQRFIIKRQLLIENYITFYKGVIHEDGPFGYLLMYFAKSVVCLSQPIYCYRQRNDSIMHSLSIRTSYDSIKNHKKLMAFCAQYVDEERKSWFMVLCSTILISSYTFVTHLFNTNDFKNFEDENRLYVINEIKKVIPLCHSKKKMVYRMFCFEPKQTSRLINYISNKLF